MDLTEQGPQCVPPPSPGTDSVSYLVAIFKILKLKISSESCKRYEFVYYGKLRTLYRNFTKFQSTSTK